MTENPKGDIGKGFRYGIGAIVAVIVVLFLCCGGVVACNAIVLSGG